MCPCSLKVAKRIGWIVYMYTLSEWDKLSFPQCFLFNATIEWMQAWQCELYLQFLFGLRFDTLKQKIEVLDGSG